MKQSFLKSALVFGISMLLVGTSYGQKKIASPRDSATGKVGQASISMNYGSPSVKGRVIWGDLVPYNKVWRAGANEATTFTTDKDILVEGKSLAKGTYGFFVIPTEKDWIIIFNKDAKQWGAYEYKQSEDVLRVTVQPKKSPILTERLIYKVYAGGISLIWENLEVPISIK